MEKDSSLCTRLHGGGHTQMVLNELDESMAAAYLRLTQYDKQQKPNLSLSLDRREFHRSRPTKGVSVYSLYRRTAKNSNWATVVRGTSRYLWCSRHYTGENLYGRYLNGDLFVINSSKGMDVTRQVAGKKLIGTEYLVRQASICHTPDLNVDTSSGVEEMLTVWQTSQVVNLNKE